MGRSVLARRRKVGVQPWLARGKVVVWLCLIIVVEVAVALALQLVAENSASRADVRELAPSPDILSAGSTCPALNEYVHHTMRIDELHDLQDQLCPTLSEPQRTGN